jgi:hypothetical protein
MTPTLHNAADISQMILGKIPRHSMPESFLATRLHDAAGSYNYLQ